MARVLLDWPKGLTPRDRQVRAVGFQPVVCNEGPTDHRFKTSVRITALSAVSCNPVCTRFGPEVRQTLRPGYSTDADSLTMDAHVIAVEFATIAAANNYWR